MMDRDKDNLISVTEWEVGMDKWIKERERSSEEEDYLRAWFTEADSFDGKDDNKISYDDLYKLLVIKEEAGELK